MSSSDGARKGRCAARYSAAMTMTTARCRLVACRWSLVVSVAPLRTPNPLLTTNHQPLTSDAQDQSFVQAAHPVPARIDGDLPVAERLNRGHDTRGQVGLEGARQLVDADLHTREVVVMAHAADAKPEIAQHAFGALDHPQLVAGHRGVVRNARRQARRGRLVPRRQPRAM